MEGRRDRESWKNRYPRKKKKQQWKLKGGESAEGKAG